MLRYVITVGIQVMTTTMLQCLKAHVVNTVNIIQVSVHLVVFFIEMCTFFSAKCIWTAVPEVFKGRHTGYL